MPKKLKTWIVVADGSHARVYERIGRTDTLATVLERDDPEARKRNRDLVSDTRGRYTGGAGGPRHAMEVKVSPHQHLEDEFVRKLAGEIDQPANGAKFDRLILIMPPKALGEMRAALSQQTRARVVAELDRDLVSLNSKDLLVYLDERLP
jgi:protein required for attachment to host cells